MSSDQIAEVAADQLKSPATPNQRAAANEQTPTVTAEFVPTDIPACVTWTNFGTVNQKLLNSCTKSHTIGVSNYAGGNHILDRIFHVKRGEERKVAFPGDLMTIDWVKGWVADGPDDGASYLSLWNHDDGGVDLWEVRNTHADRFNAVAYGVYKNGIRDGTAIDVLPPGQSTRLYAFFPGDNGKMILDWSRLDPH